MAPRSILITGASSGIGEALALTYAAPDRHLALAGRNGDRLGSVARQCLDRGAQVTASLIDVADDDAMGRWVRDMDDVRPLDVVIANAGTSGDGTHDFNRHIRDVLATNVVGAFNTVHPVLARMRARRRGHIGIMSSLAAYRGGLGDVGYGLSKAAMKLYGEGLRRECRADGVGVSVICPGYVKSRMTAHNDFPMPFLMDAPKAAEIIKRGLTRDKALIAFPRPAYSVAWLAGALPGFLWDALFCRRRSPATHGAPVLDATAREAGTADPRIRPS